MMTDIEILQSQKIDPTNEKDYRAWSANFNHALREAAPQALIAAKYPKMDSSLVVKNWVDLRCSCQKKIAS